MSTFMTSQLICSSIFSNTTTFISILEFTICLQFSLIPSPLYSFFIKRCFFISFSYQYIVAFLASFSFSGFSSINYLFHYYFFQIFLSFQFFLYWCFFFFSILLVFLISSVTSSISLLLQLIISSASSINYQLSSSVFSEISFS